VLNTIAAMTFVRFLFIFFSPFPFLKLDWVCRWERLIDLVRIAQCGIEHLLSLGAILAYSLP